MKRFNVFLVFMALLAILYLAGCSDPSASSNADGAITIVNLSNDYTITFVEVYDATTNGRIFNQRVNIESRQGSRTFSIAPGKYYVCVTDDYDYEYYSDQITVNPGATITLRYNGYDDLY